MPFSKEKFTMAARGVEMTLPICFKTLIGILFGPDALLVLKEDIISDISVESVGEKNMLFSEGV